MKAARIMAILRLAACLAAAGLLAACDSASDRTRPVDRPPSGADATYWVGAYETTTGATGRLTLKLDRAEADLAGVLVIESGLDPEPTWVSMSGLTDGDSVSLVVPDADEPADHWLLATGWRDEVLTGWLHHRVNGSFTAHRVPRDTLALVATVPLDVTPLCLAADPTRLVVAQLERWYEIDAASGARVDSFVVETAPLRNLAASFAAWDTSGFHGDLPLSDTIAFTRLVTFDTTGTILRQLDLDHRTHGLACADGGFWSLTADATALCQLAHDGATLATYPVTDPDLRRLTAFDGRLISQSRRGAHLTELNRDGTVARILDLPPGLEVVQTRGLAATPRGDLYQVVELSGGPAVLQRLRLPR